MNVSRRTLLAGAVSTAVLAGCSDNRGTLDPAYPVPASPDAIAPFSVRSVGRLGAGLGDVEEPSVAGGVIVVRASAGRARSRDRFVVAYDAASAKELWRRSMWISGYGADPQMYLATDHGVVVCDENQRTRTTKFVCADALTGREKWQLALPERDGWHGASLLGAYETLLLVGYRTPSDAYRTAVIDLSTGRELWGSNHPGIVPAQLLGDLVRIGDGTAITVVEARTGSAVAGAATDGQSGLDHGLPDTLLIRAQQVAGEATRPGRLLDVRTSRELLGAPAPLQAVGYSADRKLMGAWVDDSRTLITFVAQDKQPQAAARAAVNQPVVRRIVDGAIWLTLDGRLQPVDRTGRALATPVPGELVALSGSCLITRGPAAYSVHQVNR